MSLNDIDREHYRHAGELFGELCHAVGFGELSMTTSAAAAVAEYRWQFKAAGERYTAIAAVTFERLGAVEDLAEFARYLANGWKLKHRNTVATE